MKTKILTTTEYDGLAFDLKQQIINQVNREANYWWGKYAPYQSTMTYKERLEYLKSKGRQ